MHPALNDGLPPPAGAVALGPRGVHAALGAPGVGVSCFTHHDCAADVHLKER